MTITDLVRDAICPDEDRHWLVPYFGGAVMAAVLWLAFDRYLQLEQPDHLLAPIGLSISSLTIDETFRKPGPVQKERDVMEPDALLRYEVTLRDTMIRTMAFMLVTYAPLQLAAILFMKRMVWRVAAALPLIPMVPVIRVGMSLDAYRDGSLYGLVFYFPYAPVMVYLAIFCFVGLAGIFTRQQRRSPDAVVEDHESLDENSQPTSQTQVWILIGVVVAFILLFVTLTPR